MSFNHTSTHVSAFNNAFQNSTQTADNSSPSVTQPHAILLDISPNDNDSHATQQKLNQAIQKHLNVLKQPLSSAFSPYSRIQKQGIPTCTDYNINDVLQRISAKEKELSVNGVDICDLPASVSVKPFSTGSGKSYNSVGMSFTIMRILKQQHLDKLKKNKTNTLLIDSNIQNFKTSDLVKFTNTVFSSSKKDQLIIDPAQIEEANSLGITILPILAQNDMIDKDFTFWCSSHNKLNPNPTTNLQKLDDLIEAINFLQSYRRLSENKLLRDDWDRLRNYLKCLKSMKRAMLDIAKLKVDIELYGDELEQRERELRKIKSHYIKTCESLSRAVIEGTTEPIHTDFSAAIDDNAIEENEEGDFYIQEKNNNGLESKDDMGKNTSHSPHAVRSIFKQALQKDFYDHPITPLVKKNSQNINDCVATIKKEIIRIFNPMEFSAYSPSMILLTHAKMFTEVGELYFKPSKDCKGLGDWKRRSYSNFFEFFGKVKAFNGAIKHIQNKANRKLYIKETIFTPAQCLNEGKPKVNYYIIIDECNELFTEIFTKNTIKTIFKDASITDIVACIGRIVHSYQEGKDNQKKPAYFQEMQAISEQIEAFFKQTTGTQKLSSNQTISDFLIKFSNTNNILYADNSDALVIQKLIKNAFSASPKDFINKEELKKFYLSKKGNERYISSNKDKHSITLHEFYVVILSVLYGCMTYQDHKLVKAKKIGAKKCRNEFSAYFCKFSGSEEQQGKRSNKPIEMLLGDSDISKKYAEFLKVDSELDENIQLDHWFAYIQTFLIFRLELNKTFDTIRNDQTTNKTFFDVILSLRLHMPEIEVLKMVANNNNFLNLLSATAGKKGWCAGQFNLKILEVYANMLGVEFSLPEYDSVFDVDYAQAHQYLIDEKEKNREIDLVVYDDYRSLLNNPSLEKVHKNLAKALLEPESNERSDMASTKKILKGFYGDNYKRKNFQNMLAGLIKLVYKKEHFFMMSQSADLFRLLQKGIVNQIVNDPKFDNEIEDYLKRIVRLRKFAYQAKLSDIDVIKRIEKTPLIFSLPKYVIPTNKADRPQRLKVNLPLLDRKLRQLTCEKIKNDHRLFQLNPYNVQENIECERLISNIIGNLVKGVKNILQDEDSNLGLIVDFHNFAELLEKSEPEGTHPKSDNKQREISRVIFFNTNLKKDNVLIDNYLVQKNVVIYNHKNDKDKINARITPAVLSYFKVADTGISLTIKNETISTPEKEDIKNILIVGFDYYTWLNEKGTDTQLLQSQVVLRRLGESGQTYSIRDYDSSLSLPETNSILFKEMGVLRMDGMRQKVGRGERKDTVGFKSTLFIGKEALGEYKNAVNNLYEISDSGEPQSNLLDYNYQSMNSRVLFNKSIELINAQKLTQQKREFLETDTVESAEILNLFCNGEPMRRILELARSGDKDALEFDLKYRDIKIITDPKMWHDELRQCNLLKVEKVGLDNYDLNQAVNAMLIDKKEYTENMTSPLYISSEGGLTDILGKKKIDIPYTEPYFFFPAIESNKSDSLEKNIPVDNNNNDDDIKLSEEASNKLFITRYNQFVKQVDTQLSSKCFGRYIIHPAMNHMIRGNIGEAVFKLFIKIFMPNKPDVQIEEMMDKLGSEVYEYTDFWFKNSKWVAIDIKNHSHYNNEHAAKGQVDSQNRKREKSFIYEHLDLFFSESDFVLFVTLNVNPSPFSTDKSGMLSEESDFIEYKGRKCQVKYLRLNMFDSIRDPISYIDKNRKLKTIDFNYHTISQHVFDILEVPSSFQNEQYYKDQSYLDYASTEPN